MRRVPAPPKEQGSRLSSAFQALRRLLWLRHRCQWILGPDRLIVVPRYGLLSRPSTCCSFCPECPSFLLA